MTTEYTIGLLLALFLLGYLVIFLIKNGNQK